MRGVLTSLVLVCAAAAGALRAQTAADIVLYGSDVSTLRGNWTKIPGSDAAGGQLLASADAGGATVDPARPVPSDYFEATFTGEANTPYHLWLRLRATADAKFNDSVWVQFNDAIDANGSALFRIGTTDALLVNLEGCGGCDDAGWGWQDGAWWLNQTQVVRFPTTGSHTIRLQVREDGVQVDQIILSASTYMSTAPGQATNDTTIVPKPATLSSSTSTPFYGTPASVPGTIQAADFDSGGEGVAYHDTTPGNMGGSYRNTDVDLEPSSVGGYDVGWIDAGEWLNYTVNVASSGAYTVSFQVAATGQGGTFHLEMNGVDVSGPLSIPDTRDWQNWQTVSADVTLAGGQQVARLVMDRNGPGSFVGNVASFQFAAGGSGGSGGSDGGLTPFGGSPVNLPGTVRAENFDNGGEGVAYHDTTTGNSGGAYRSTDVDIEASSEGSYDVGWTAAGEWLNYTVSVASAGSYTAKLRVASPSGASMHLGFNNTSSVWEVVSVPNTGGWQAWTTVNVPVTLGAGVQQITLGFDTPGLNISSITVVGASIPPPDLPSSPSVPTGAVDVAINPSLSWSASGAASYDVRFGPVNPPPPAVSNITVPAYIPGTLNNSTTYYWQVVARNSGGTTSGPIWSFTTASAPGGTDALRLVVFHASADHATSVVSYAFDVFAAGADPSIATPVASSSLGKPAPDANGDIIVDRSAFFSALAPGDYVATVSAVGAGGSSRSAPATFTR